MSVIRMKDVSFSYASIQVLENVNLEIDDGELISVVGPNGGGKTTLIKLMLGLLQPDSGKIEVLDREPVSARRYIGYMPQHGHFDPMFPVTVLDIVLMGRLGRSSVGIFSRVDHRMASEALDTLGMAEYSSRLFSELSGGQRQRVLIARALACSPRILLLDEPTANVDIKVEEQLMDTIKRLNESMTILLVSHDLGFVSEMVERVICVNRRVVVHPTSEINGDVIRQMYEGKLKVVRHDHHWKRHD
ncbi:ABC transporter ATP-binding protein [bacterium]|nr:ABC transporter ATP-binding protein [candidate division CSSED10-310 bacterium]